MIEPYGPNVEPYITENCFIPKDPVLMAREAWGNDINMMIGGCSNEGLFFMPYLKQFGKIHETLSIERHVATEFEWKKGDPKRNYFGSQIKKLYYGCTEPSESNLVGYFEVSRFFNPFYVLIIFPLEVSYRRLFLVRNLPISFVKSQFRRCGSNLCL